MYLWYHPTNVRYSSVKLQAKGHTIRYLLANFFTTFAKKLSIFWRSTSDNFFLCFVEEIKFLFFVVCFPYYVRYYLVFFSGKHIFHQLRQQTIFSCPHFQQTFFLTFVRQSIFFNFFLASSPPPDINWCVPNLHIPDQLEKVSLLSMCHNTANMHSY